MNDIQQVMRERYPGNTWADVARRDGPLPDVLSLQANPKQDLRDISFALIFVFVTMLSLNPISFVLIEYTNEFSSYKRLVRRCKNRILNFLIRFI